MKIDKYLLTLVVIVFLFFTPFFLKPDYLTLKDNDLGRSYFSIESFFKDSIYTYKQFPLWKPDQMMGESFIGNPLSSLVYPPNILFILMPISLASIFYLFLHFEIAAISAYFVARDLKLNKIAALSAGIFYALSPKLLLHLSAGHLTMIASAAFIPIIFLSARKLISKPSLNWIVIGALSFAFSFITYATIFYYTSIFIFFYCLYKFSRVNKNPKALIDFIKPFLLLGIITFGLIAIVLIPQLEFSPLSSRSSMKIEDVAIPLWNLKKFLSSLIFPYYDFAKFDQESLLYIGAIPAILAISSFFRLSKIRKILIAAFGLLALLFAAGSSAFAFKIAYTFIPLVKYSRVTTRIWFILIFIAALLAAYAIHKIKNRKISFLLIGIFLLETLSIGYFKIVNSPNLSSNNQNLYEYWAQDHDSFRVYCTTYCFNPQLLFKYKIKTLAGETPIQQKSFIDFLSQVGNYKWNNFAVIFPPYQVWQVPNPPQPNSTLLGLANVKYVASTYPLADSQFNPIKKFENIYLYKNSNFKSKYYFENTNQTVFESYYSPNAVNLKFEPAAFQRDIIISQNYYPGWSAYANNQKIAVEKYQNFFQKVTIPSNTSNLWLAYQPKSYAIGKTITFSTLIFLVLCYIHRKKKK